MAFLLEAGANESVRPFPATVMEALRRAIPCDVVSYREWDTTTGYIDQAFAGDVSEERRKTWNGYPALRHEAPLPSGRGSPSLPDRDRVGTPLLLSDVISHRRFERTACFPRSAARSAYVRS